MRYLKAGLLLVAGAVIGAVLLWRTHPPVAGLQVKEVKSESVAKFKIEVIKNQSVAASPRTRSIVAPIPGTPSQDRFKALHALNANMTEEEIHGFYQYLLSPSDSTHWNRSEENWLRNDMMDKLVRQQSIPKDMAGVFVSIYQDHMQDVVMRDYSVQHMDPLYERVDESDKALLAQTLWDATTETDSTIAGTALLALQHLAQGDPELDKDRIARTALNVAWDEGSGELSRATAVQICGRMRVSGAKPVAMSLAQNAGSIPLRIAAIAALGELGDKAALEYLEQLEKSNNPRLKPAVEMALKRMQERLGT